MAEIKSTLDIIMEKTRGLTMNDEEKRAFQKSEVEGKVGGAVQRFLDGLINRRRLTREIDALVEDYHEMATQAVIRECLDRIDPKRDNTPILDVLEDLGGLDPAPFREIIAESHRDLEQRKTDRQSALLSNLDKKGISGTAVIPNIEADREWARYVSETEKDLDAKLNLLRPGVSD
ncbi:MAG: hypothetical protein SV775_00545 [Thermodesulfobacteriota bacterium]|nr:hypothetical protein [Thermodesulfobacteriota bacterium]